MGRPVNAGERESGILLFLAIKRIIARLYGVQRFLGSIIGVMGVISITGENPL
jgi:hypothetical protein